MNTTSSAETLTVTRLNSTTRAAWNRHLLPYLLVAPLIVLLLIFIFRPVAYSLYLSLQEWRLGSSQPVFIGVENYKTLFGNSNFWNALRNSLLYTISIGGLSLISGLGLALALRHVVSLREAWHAIFFLPVAATMSAMAVVWRFILNPAVGPLNAAVSALGLPPQDWLSSDLWAHVAVVWVGIWGSAGYAMVLFSAGLTAIPRELHEAAAIDGASPLQQFRLITLPLLAPTMLFTTVIITLRAMENFDTIKILTDGGPLNATQTLSHLLFQEGFQFFNAGYASSLAVIYFLILLGIAAVQLRVARER